MSSFSLEQRGAVLAIWSKLSRSSCLDALKNSITNSEAETYLNKVIPLTPHRPINVLAAPHYSRNPITISQVKSLDAVNNIFGVGENFTWNEIENAFAVSNLATLFTELFCLTHKSKLHTGESLYGYNFTRRSSIPTSIYT